MYSQWIKIYYLLIVIGWINIAMADLILDPKYGNGQTDEFIKIMYGYNNDARSAEEEKFLTRANYVNNNNKYFLRIGSSLVTDRLYKINNASPTGSSFAELKVMQDNFRNTNQSNLEFSFGYLWSNKLIGDLELILSNNFQLRSGSLFETRPDVMLNSNIKSKTLLLNGYYNVFTFKFINILIGAGIGLGLNVIDANFKLNNPNLIDFSNKKTVIAGSYSLAIGCKINIISQCFVTILARTIETAGFGTIKGIKTGSLNFDYPGQELKLNAKRGFKGISVNFVHVFI